MADTVVTEGLFFTYSISKSKYSSGKSCITGKRRIFFFIWGNKSLNVPLHHALFFWKFNARFASSDFKGSACSSVTAMLNTLQWQMLQQQRTKWQTSPLLQEPQWIVNMTFLTLIRTYIIKGYDHQYLVPHTRNALYKEIFYSIYDSVMQQPSFLCVQLTNCWGVPEISPVLDVQWPTCIYVSCTIVASTTFMTTSRA